MFPEVKQNEVESIKPWAVLFISDLGNEKELVVDMRVRSKTTATATPHTLRFCHTVCFLDEIIELSRMNVELLVLLKCWGLVGVTEGFTAWSCPPWKLDLCSHWH